jgi:hypothetical protein
MIPAAGLRPIRPVCTLDNPLPDHDDFVVTRLVLVRRRHMVARAHAASDGAVNIAFDRIARDDVFDSVRPHIEPHPAAAPSIAMAIVAIVLEERLHLFGEIYFRRRGRSSSASGHEQSTEQCSEECKNKTGFHGGVSRQTFTKTHCLRQDPSTSREISRINVSPASTLIFCESPRWHTPRRPRAPDRQSRATTKGDRYPPGQTRPGQAFRQNSPAWFFDAGE